jgi:hypothetical protein
MDELIGKIDPESLSWDELDESYSAKWDHYGRIKHTDELNLEDDTFDSKVFYKLDVPKGYRKRKGASLQKTMAEIDLKLERGEYVNEKMFHSLDQAFETARPRSLTAALEAYSRWQSAG